MDSKFGFCAVLAWMMVGCSGNGTTATDAGMSDAPVHCSGGNATAGQALVMSRNCASCHGVDLGGGNLSVNPGPNLTPTELSGWSDDQVATAVLDGIDDEGATLCASMYRYRTNTAVMRLTEAQACDLTAYLRTLPSVTRNVAACSN